MSFLTRSWRNRLPAFLSKAAAELTAYEAQLRPQNLSPGERIEKMRKRFRELMNPLYEPDAQRRL